MRNSVEQLLTEKSMDEPKKYKKHNTKKKSESISPPQVCLDQSPKTLKTSMSAQLNTSNQLTKLEKLENKGMLITSKFAASYNLERQRNNSINLKAASYTKPVSFFSNNIISNR